MTSWFFFKDVQLILLFLLIYYDNVLKIKKVTYVKEL